MHRTVTQLLLGRDEPAREPISLRAGPLSLLLDGADLRRVMLGELEVAQRIYVAVRDPNWGTVPGELSNLQLQRGDDWFSATFEMSHRAGDIAFSWRGELRGEPNGELTYAMRGEAQTDFPYNVIGICVHHPLNAAGRPFQTQGENGARDGVLPFHIGPQLLRDGAEVPIIPAFHTLKIDLDGARVTFKFDGGEHETEDQRNWTDANFKTYSLPPGNAGPRRATAGQKVAQTLALSVEALCPTVHASPDSAPIRVSLGDETGACVPPIGLGMASHGEPPSKREVEVLRSLKPSHLRADVHLSRDWPKALSRALEACRQLDCALELALFLPGAGQLHPVAQWLWTSPVKVARVLMFRDGEAVSSLETLRSARELFPNMPLFGGTNVYFCDLNRDPNAPASVAECDGLSYSINPQVHAFDELSLMENLEAQGETLRSARAKFGSVQLCVSPVTLKPRFNAVQKFPSAPAPPDALPLQVDARQMSLFGAAWTLGALKELCENGASSLTFYETTGARAVMERETGSSLPRFPSRAGEAFPLFHVLADVCALVGARVLSCRSSDARRVLGLGARMNGKSCLLLANLTPHAQNVQLQTRLQPLSARRLNAFTAPVAMSAPQAFRDFHMTVSRPDFVHLLPYETLLIESA